MALNEVFINHEYENPLPDDGVHPTIAYNMPSDWNAEEILSGSTGTPAAASLCTYAAGSATGAAWRSLAVGSGLTIAVTDGAITVSADGSAVTGSGTPAYLTKWNITGNALEDTSVYEDDVYGLIINEDAQVTGDLSVDGTAVFGTYAGQTSITTLGTVTVGTWNATAIAVNHGGTGLTSYAVGDILHATNTATIGGLADVATGNAVISGGIGAVPTYGKIGLTTHISGTLAATNGGTGIASYAVGDLLYASTTTALSKLADVAVGSYLRSGGTDTAPLWSTLILPNAATSGRIVYASATNTYGESANLTFDGTSFAIGTAGPHAVGGAVNAGIGWYQRGTFTSTQAFARGFQIDQTLVAGAASGNLVGIYVNPVLTEYSSGTHPILAGIYVEPSVTAGTADATIGAGIYIAQSTFQTTTTSGASLYIANATAGATTNYALWVAAGAARFQAAGPHSFGGNPTSTSNIQVEVAGSYTSGTNQVEGLSIRSTLTPNGSFNGFGAVWSPTIATQTSAVTVPLAVGAYFKVTASEQGSGVITTAASLYVDAPAGSNVDNAYSLYIAAAPSIGTALNYALFVDSGNTRLDGITLIGQTDLTGLSAGDLYSIRLKTGAPNGGTAALWKLGTVAVQTPTSPNRTIEVDIAGTIYYLAAKTTND